MVTSLDLALDCLLRREATPQAVVDSNSFDLCYWQEVCGNHFTSVQCNSDVAALISTLLFWRRPSAISRLVSEIVIYPVNLMLPAWAGAHVSKKVTEVPPALADRNSPAAVVVKVAMTRITAALAHALPDAIFRRL